MTEKRESQVLKESLETWMQHRSSPHKSWETYDEYLVAMKRAHNAMNMSSMITPRARHRQKVAAEIERKEIRQNADANDQMHISTIATMIPDEIILNNLDSSLRSYETALMFIDVSGFTELCEAYTKSGRGGPSKLTHVLNSYIGAMVQEILAHHGDVLKFGGDAFLSMWKKCDNMTMQDVAHIAIDCGLIIQKNYGTHETDLGITLKVKVAITAGVSHFSVIGDEARASFIIVGQAVWDVKTAQCMSTAGDVLTSAGIWAYVNEAEYCTQPSGDGRHTKVLGVGVTWKRVEKLAFAPSYVSSTGDLGNSGLYSGTVIKGQSSLDIDDTEAMYKEFSLRPSVIKALRGSWWPSLRRFMMTPVLRAVDNDEPIDNLTEVRHVVIVFLNLITRTVTEDVLVDVVNKCYKQVCRVTSEAGGLVNKVSLFDKDTMFLVVFGLRGLKHEDEAQKALLCAFELKQTLKDPNILNVSIGVTSGRTYCGVVGHVLRREYTVIGSSVNKAARLMTSYQDKVTCDKETFVRSKLDLDLFRLLEQKALKGIQAPGPIYEFNKSGWPERMIYVRHPILGRNEELRIYKRVLQNAIDHQEEDFTRYRDMRYGIIITGPRLVGKKRLVEEFISVTPNEHRVLKLTLTSHDTVPYQFIRILLQKLFENGNSKAKNVREAFANRIRHSIGMLEITPLQIHAINTIFDLRFPLPENFSYSGDILADFTVKDLIQEIFNLRLPYLILVVVHEGQFIDDSSWRVLLYVLDVKSIFIIIVLNEPEPQSEVAKACIANNIFVKMHLRGIDRWYHAALACQLLDVQAIPADLEKVLESASGGLPGWIQNFVISLIQRGNLTVVSVPRAEAVESRAVMPLPAMLQRVDDEASRDVDVVSTVTEVQTEQSRISAEYETIQMAVLTENYNFNDMNVDMTMDVIILKTYDSLTPFEKIILKCASVIGETFSRRMLLHLLQSDSQRKVAMAVARLFEIRVLECEGGDFSQDTSVVMIHPGPAPNPAVKPPYCACVGTREPPNCHGLPMYAFCGYMKFRHALFRTTTYELLTENQKQELHTRSLTYLERYTRCCRNCGGGCFVQLFGVRSNDGLMYESRELRRVRQQIVALGAETRISSDTPSDTGITSINSKVFGMDTGSRHMIVEKKKEQGTKHKDKISRLKSFSSLDLEKCECLPILLSVYKEVIDHIRVVGNCEKLFETYIEYVDLSLMILNIPQAIRLLMEVEKKLETTGNHTNLCKLDWVKDYRAARIASMRGSCMLESGEYGEARRHLLHAMKLYGCKFPTSKHGVKFRNMQATLEQNFSMYCTKRFTRYKAASWVGQYLEHISRTLNQLYVLFTERKERKNAALAAKWSLKFASKSNDTFRLLCVCYGNMICVYRQMQNFSKCMKLEKLALDICHRKRGHLDITEVNSVCTLYTNIFLFYVEHGRKEESLDFGMSIIPMMSGHRDIYLGQMLVLWLLKILISNLRITEMVVIMREFFYMTDHYDLSSEAWYYYYALEILLDTGFCVETYNQCEQFYIKQGDAIMRSRTPEAAWNFFVCMWLVTLRIGSWERAILWHGKIKKIKEIRFQFTEYHLMLLVRLVEGFMISLVEEIDKRNLKKIISLDKNLKSMFKRIQVMCRQMPLFRPRSLMLYAYYHMVKAKKSRAHRYLEQAQALAKHYNLEMLTIWMQHTKDHWNHSLNPRLVNYWTEHVDILDYKTFEKETKIIPYTLPLPKDLEY